MPKLSVIVPVYNVEKYLSECIDSILNNTFSDFELILIDDGSADGSGAICDEYALKDDRIKVLHNNNMGVSAARNCGIRCAKGEYISFVDSDDYVDDTMFAKLISKISENNLDVVKCGYAKDTSKNIAKKKFSKKDSIFKGNTSIRFSMEGAFFTIPCNAVYRKELVEKVMFPEGIVYEDVYFSGMMLYFARKIGFVEEILYFYRYNPDSISNKVALEKRPLDYLVALSRLHEELLRHGLSDKKVYKFIKKRMAGRLYGVLKRTKYNLKMSKEFYVLMCDNLSFMRKLKMIIYRIKGRIVLLK